MEKVHAFEAMRKCYVYSRSLLCHLYIFVTCWCSRRSSSRFWCLFLRDHAFQIYVDGLSFKDSENTFTLDALFMLSCDPNNANGGVTNR